MKPLVNDNDINTAPPPLDRGQKNPSDINLWTASEKYKNSALLFFYFIDIFVRYTSKKPENLANLVTKYQQRNGWSHKDLLRLCHVKTDKTTHNIIFRFNFTILISIY